MAYKTGNPALNANTFNNLESGVAGEVMTLEGTSNKSLVMLGLALIAGYFGWSVTLESENGILFLFGAIIAGLILALITIFAKKTAPITAPLYAIAEGFVLGFISHMYEAEFNGIVIQAIVLTSGIFFSMLMLYRLRIIEATQNLKLGIVAATGGIAIYYLANLIAGFWGIQLPLITDNSTMGIVFSVIVVVIAAFNLVLDFDFIESGVEQGAPKYMKWYSAFGLFVTMVWLYLEILRLLGKSRRS